MGLSRPHKPIPQRRLPLDLWQDLPSTSTEYSARNCVVFGYTFKNSAAGIATLTVTDSSGVQLPGNGVALAANNGEYQYLSREGDQIAGLIAYADIPGVTWSATVYAEGTSG